MNVYLDVETVPSQAADALEQVRAGIRPPGTLKKPESIAAWWRDEADAAAAEAHRKQSLDGGTAGEIVSIAACLEDEGQWVRCRARGESEAELLRAFFAAVEVWTQAEAEAVAGLSSAWPLEVFPVAHNAAFDLGFLWRRAIVCRVPAPRWLPGPLARAGHDYGDTMTAWAGWGGRVPLGALCRVLRVPDPKADGLDGSRVYEAWTAGECERIALYNLRDALAVREVWHRLQGRGLL